MAGGTPQVVQFEIAWPALIGTTASSFRTINLTLITQHARSSNGGTCSHQIQSTMTRPGQLHEIADYLKLMLFMGPWTKESCSRPMVKSKPSSINSIMFHQVRSQFTKMQREGTGKASGKGHTFLQQLHCRRTRLRPSAAFQNVEDSPLVSLPGLCTKVAQFSIVHELPKFSGQKK